MFIVQFYHAHFGWLTYDIETDYGYAPREFETISSAACWMAFHTSPYKQRIVKG